MRDWVLVLMVFSALVCRAGYVDEVMADSPEAYYRFEEISGSLTDSSGNGHDSLVLSNVVLGTEGLMGRAASFSNGFAVLDLNLSPDAGSFSIEAVVRFDGEGNQHIAAQQDGTGTGRSMLYTDGLAGASYLGRESSYFSKSFEQGSWCHVVMTVENGGSGEDIVRFYLDGEPCGSNAVNAEFADGNWVLGAAKIYNKALIGALDEVAVYPLVLSEDRILTHYAELLSIGIIDITNADEVVSTETARYAISGTHNEYIVGTMSWTNAANGAGGEWQVADAEWQVADIPLAFGVNIITVSGTNVNGVTFSDSVTIRRSLTHCVSVAGTSIPPYTSWVTAATNIQDAVDASIAGDIVLVTNGVYDTGETVTPGYASLNRVLITNDITVRSVHGPEFTFIVGEGPLGSNAVRGVFMSIGTLSGFTITNGHTAVTGYIPLDEAGGGINLRDGVGVVSNCVLSRNFSQAWGGGSIGGTLIDCTFAGNNAVSKGGGSYDSTLNNCLLEGNTSYRGGGGYGGTLKNCTLTNNSAGYEGGGSFGSTLTNCTLSGNSADSLGGGSSGGTLDSCMLSENSAGYGGGGSGGGTLNNCTLMKNSAGRYGGGSRESDLNSCLLVNNHSSEFAGGSWRGTLKNCLISGNVAKYSAGGVDACTLFNCIVYGNNANSYNNHYNSSMANSCTAPAVSGTGNISDNPQFVDAAAGNYHLVFSSPCINAGSNTYVTGSIDLDGNARIVNETVDMGPYEYDEAISDSDGDGLTDGYEKNVLGSSLVSTNTDGDACSDYQEYVAGTDPTDGSDWFHLSSFGNGAVSFQSLETRSYTLLYCTNLVGGSWVPLKSRMGIGGPDSMDCSNNVPQAYYKVQVELP